MGWDGMGWYGIGWDGMYMLDRTKRDPCAEVIVIVYFSRGPRAAVSFQLPGQTFAPNVV